MSLPAVEHNTAVAGEVVVNSAISPGGSPVPRNVCVTCGEFEPHACVPVLMAAAQPLCMPAGRRACGSVSAHRGGCRGTACVAAYNAWQGHRRRMQAYGTWQPFTDPAPVISHLRSLTAAGVSGTAIAAVAGVHYSTVAQLLRPSAHWRRGIQSATAQALLKVTPEQCPVPKRVDTTGTRRRLQALAAAGWPATALAGRLGMFPEVVRNLMRGSWTVVSARTAAAVRALYEELQDVPGPSVRARNLAHGRSWAAAGAWDGEDIDDPAAAPTRPGALRMSRAARTAAMLEDSEELLRRHGLTLTQAAERLGTSRDTLERARLRHGLRMRGTAA